jgi:hypothetical protein
MCWRRDAEAPALKAAREVIRAEVKALRRGESTHTIRADAELVRTLF